MRGRPLPWCGRRPERPRVDSDERGAMRSDAITPSAVPSTNSCRRLRVTPLNPQRVLNSALPPTKARTVGHERRPRW